VITIVGGQVTAVMTRERVTEASLLTGISARSQMATTANATEG
jgi:hypothetical protein